MTSLAPVVLGAPGVVYLPAAPPRALGAVRMDVAAFVGVAPRGPAFELADAHDWPYPEGIVRTRSVPVAIESWDEYAETFGSFEGPGTAALRRRGLFRAGRHPRPGRADRARPRRRQRRRRAAAGALPTRLPAVPRRARRRDGVARRPQRGILGRSPHLHARLHDRRAELPGGRARRARLRRPGARQRRFVAAPRAARREPGAARRRRHRAARAARRDGKRAGRHPRPARGGAGVGRARRRHSRRRRPRPAAGRAASTTAGSDSSQRTRTGSGRPCSPARASSSSPPPPRASPSPTSGSHR